MSDLTLAPTTGRARADKALIPTGTVQPEIVGAGPSRAQRLGVLVGIPTLLVGLFVLLTWYSEIFRRGVTRVAPYMPIALYASPAILFIFFLARRARGQAAFRLSLETRAGRVTSLLVAPIGLASAAIAYLFPIVQSWQANPIGYSAFAGAVPWSDANGYYAGAHGLLFNGQLDAWNSRRPINATFLAFRLLVTDLDLRWALIIQGLLLGVACYFAARAVARDLGIVAGLLLFAGIYGFASFGVETTLTESLGVTLGALAFTTLWYAVRDRRPWLALSGVLILTLALDARAGTIFMVLALPIWFAYYFRQSSRFSLKVLGAGFAAVAIGVAMNGFLVVVLGGELSNLNGNVYYTLYGLAKGNKGWGQLYVDFPNAIRLPEVQRTEFVRKKFFEQVGNDPVLFIKGLERSGHNYVTNAEYQSTQPFYANTAFRYALYVALAVIAALVLARRWRSTRWSALRDALLFASAIISMPVAFLLWQGEGAHYWTWLPCIAALAAFLAYVVIGSDRVPMPVWSLAAAGMVGIAASIPFLPLQDAGTRVFAATVPFFVFSIAGIGAILQRAVVDAPAEMPVPVPRAYEHRWVPVVIAGTITLAIFVVTPIAAFAATTSTARSRPCPGGRPAEAFTAGVAVHLVNPGDKHDVDELELSRLGPDRLEIAGLLQHLKAGTTIMAAYALRGPKQPIPLIVVHGRVDPPGRSVLYLCGTLRKSPAVPGARILFSEPVASS